MMKKKKKKMIQRAAVFLLGLLLWVNAAEAIGAQEQTIPDPLEDLQLYAQSAVLMDADTGRVLYEKNGFTPMAMASTTKIMTCITALEWGGLEEEAVVSAYAASMPKVKLGVKQGERYLIRDLLYSLMLESHNDSAVVIAEHIGRRVLDEQEKTGGRTNGALAGAKEAVENGTDVDSKTAVAAFIARMNGKAQELGCENTWFITPNGLDAVETVAQLSDQSEGSRLQKEHSTTAAELARMMAYCIGESSESETFLKITGAASYTFQANGREFVCTNHNAFLNMMEGALSGKTGFTNKAGYCYVGALKSGERTFTVALLACGWPNHKTYKWSDTKTLMQYGINHYKYRTYAQALDQWFADNEGRDVMVKVMVEGGCSSRLGETAYTALKLGTVPEGGMLLREDERLTVHFELPATLPAPVTEGSVVGEVIWQLHGTVQATAPVRCIDAVAKITPQWCIEQIVRRFLIAFSDQMR